MRPFGWLPSHLKWDVRPTREFTGLYRDFQIQIHDRLLVQRVNEHWAACITIDRHANIHDVERVVASLNSAHSNTRLQGLNASELNDLWPKSDIVPNYVLDMNPSIDPKLLVLKYEETLLAQGPLALFPKQVLSKLRAVVDSKLYLEHLVGLLKTPAEIDTKYVFDKDSETSPFIDQVRKLANGVRPLSSVFQDLKTRDTQLQVIIGLEVLTQTTDYVQLLDLHFDRLCIWQAVQIGAQDSVKEFCMSVLVPFFKTRTPEKIKQLLRITKGMSKSKLIKRVKTQNENPADISTQEEVNKDKSSSGGMTILARALQMQNLVKQTEPKEPNPQKKRRVSLENLASRSVSHPVYRQATLKGQLEVKFRKNLPRRSTSVSRPPLPMLRDEPIIDTNEISDVISKPDSHLHDPLEMDDCEIGSTDSD